MISISVCMIIKNEEKVLERCLKSLEGLYEELVIVDTGSTDRSKEIAAQYTDKIYDFKWVNDFSEARNFAFSKATCDYIYSADADEVLGDDNRRRFLELKQLLLPEIEIVQMWYINRPEFATTESLAKEYRPKLYKRLRTFTWIDPVHEAVNLNPVVYDSDIEILHMPISLHTSRDLSIFADLVERGTPLSLKLIKMYACELMVSGSLADFERACPYFNFLLNDNRENKDLPLWCYCVLAKYNRLAGFTAEFFKWALKSVVTTACSEICFELGQFYFDQKDYDEAIIWFINASSETQPVLDGFSAGLKPLEALSLCYERLAAENELLSETYLGLARDYALQAEEFRK